jgi:hypothetical protein
MKESNLVWQCDCGHVSYDELPEDCESCMSIGKFKRVPEDMIEEAAADEILSLRPEDEE